MIDKSKKIVTLVMMFAVTLSMTLSSIPVYAQVEDSNLEEMNNMVKGIEENEDTAQSETVAIDEINFPDEGFRNYVSDEFDKDHDGTLSQKEINNGSMIGINGREDITNLKGIEYLTQLETLDCGGTGITSLDVSQNPELIHLRCSKTKITSLDVSENPKLINLYCDNTQITSLDVSNNLELSVLDFSYTQIPTLDVSKQSELTYLNCGKTQIKSLDVSKNSKLAKLYCVDIQIKSLDVSQNLELTHLDCSDTKIDTLDVSQNSKLTFLNCNSIQVTDLDVSQNSELTQLYCVDLPVTTLDVSNNPKLFHLACSNTKITALDVSNNPKLFRLTCTNTKITNLDVSTNLELTHLYCNETNLAYLNLGENKNIEMLSIFNMNTFNINVERDSFDITELFPGIDVSKITIKSGATLNGNMVSGYSFGDTINYEYDCGIYQGQPYILNVRLTLPRDESTITINKTLDKVYDKQEVSLSKNDCTITGSNGEVVFTYYELASSGNWVRMYTNPVNAGVYKVVAEIVGEDCKDEKQFTISKAIPTVPMIPPLTSVEGDTLSKVELPDGFTWQDDETTSVGERGENSFEVTYTPQDTRNYEIVRDIEVTVTVNPKMETLNAVPTIKAEDKTIKVGEVFDVKAGVSAIDEEDGDITNKIEVIYNDVNTSKAGTYTVTYKVTDKEGASATKTIKIVVEEKTPDIEEDNKPMETLNTVPTIKVEDKTIKVGEVFEAKAGVSAIDEEDGDITDKIEVIYNDVDTSKVGTYTVTYKVTDKEGASVTKTIKVVVEEKTPDIEEDNKPIEVEKENSPSTSDMTQVGLWSMLVVLSGGLLGLIIKGKKGKKV